MLLEDVLAGALARGVNKPTLVILNVVLLGCILVLVGLLFLTGATSPELLRHLLFLLLLAAGLIAATNWVVGQLGTVSVEEQRRELFGPGESEGQAPPSREQQQQQQETQQQRQGAAGGNEIELEAAAGKKEQ